MNLDRRTSEYPAERDDAKQRLDQNWRDGLIGDDGYLRSIMLLGYGDRDAHCELAHLKLDKPVTYEERKLAESRAWLREKRHG